MLKERGKNICFGRKMTRKRLSGKIRSSRIFPETEMMESGNRSNYATVMDGVDALMM